MLRIDGITPPLNSLNSGEPRLAQKIKLSTIADALGVSTATVSLALRDSPLVAGATRDRIKEHARAIGYIYNRRAASLRTSRSGMNSPLNQATRSLANWVIGPPAKLLTETSA